MSTPRPASPAPPLDGLAAFNALDRAGAEAELLTCCASTAFARRVAGLRPYPDLDRLAGTAEAVVRELDWPDVREALAAHPRIGEAPRAPEPPPGRPGPSGPGDATVPADATGPGDATDATGPTGPTGPADVAGPADPAGRAGSAGPTGRESAWSRQEQSGVGAAGPGILDRLAEGNRAYERRFGHVYLVCATGLSAAELLDRLTGRLGNDEGTERDVVRAELAAITRLRLAKLLAPVPAPPPGNAA
ncbi:2-oxo-4-hydroxy-4-carboxy-5-ureidoimidazoline decarboxylase [Streptosporangium sp. NPDC023615]|uniref:2-oxo-4-hydroxy-4-carboxy-5-ureidoimidazoline decarboxylase n=1 Tax=Streptosporangium sp. NPDC023615 TaxID=3154794 RepID=UPI003415FA58